MFFTLASSSSSSPPLSGYEGPKPDWYYADTPDYDPSARSYNEGVEAYFDNLAAMGECTDFNGQNSPWKEYWYAGTGDSKQCLVCGGGEGGRKIKRERREKEKEKSEKDLLEMTQEGRFNYTVYLQPSIFIFFVFLGTPSSNCTKPSLKMIASPAKRTMG
jgi:hypothetical protein